MREGERGKWGESRSRGGGRGGRLDLYRHMSSGGRATALVFTNGPGGARNGRNRRRRSVHQGMARELHATHLCRGEGGEERIRLGSPWLNELGANEASCRSTGASGTVHVNVMLELKRDKI